MGQSASAPGYSSGSVISSPGSNRRRYITANQSELMSFSEAVTGELAHQIPDEMDYTLELPDECLALIFQCLSSGDRKRCSVVCQRWLAVEGESRHRLALNATADIQVEIPALFTRFDSVTKLALRCDRKSTSLNDDGLTLISLRCRGLTRLKLRGCRQVSDRGMESVAKNCKVLKKFSCGSCTFGAEGMNALLDNCSTLEELSVKRLRGGNDGVVAAPIGPGAAAASLKSICLKELYNGLSFGPLILESKNLKTLKLLRCLGDWDRLLESMAKRDENKNTLVEIHLERLQLSDLGLMAIAKCRQLEILHLVKALDCTNIGVVEVAEHCKLLRKLHIDGWRSNRIGDDGLIAIAKHSVNLQELVLIGLNPTSLSMSAIASSCKKLERLALCGSETIGDAEISYIAEKCVALRKLCIKGCHVSDQGIEAFAWGCPNLVKIKVKKCRDVTSEFADWLRARRATLTVSLDVEETEVEAVEVSASDTGELEEVVDYPASSVSRVGNAGGSDVPSSQNPVRSSAFKSRLGIFGGRGFVACTFGRWMNGNSTSNSV